MKRSNKKPILFLLQYLFTNHYALIFFILFFKFCRGDICWISEMGSPYFLKIDFFNKGETFQIAFLKNFISSLELF